MVQSASLPASVAITTPGGDESVRWVVIAVVGWAEAEVIRSKLNAAGIPCILQREAAGVAFGITIGALGEVRVLVPEPLVKQAIELLNDTAGHEGADDEDIGDWDDYEVEGGRKTTPDAPASD
ncbi:MAG: putative signal transducing protein [Candidatus Roseilinea sp.]|uniref:putative signal transducing protein n=1 Tax=Candidatus Roseilinea sp. TaxID=2838777 RepID=UPI0040490A8B